MNENIDLTKILKDCPEGFKLYTPMFGEVEFKEIRVSFRYAIKVSYYNGFILFTQEGLFYDSAGAECLLFPSAEQRDWGKFKAPWLKKKKFDPKTLQPFDKVLVKDRYSQCWRCNLFSHIETEYPMFRVNTILVGNFYYCIPYNEDTKHLVGTTEEAPEFYRYWEE